MARVKQPRSKAPVPFLWEKHQHQRGTVSIFLTGSINSGNFKNKDVQGKKVTHHSFKEQTSKERKIKKAPVKNRRRRRRGLQRKEKEKNKGGGRERGRDAKKFPSQTTRRSRIKQKRLIQRQQGVQNAEAVPQPQPEGPGTTKEEVKVGQKKSTKK